MFRSLKWSALLLLPLSITTAQITPEPAANSDCSFSANSRTRPERERWHEVSAMTEMAKRGRGVVRGPVGSIPRKNFVDDEIFAVMDRDGVKPTVLASDEEFLRRTTLDLTGQIPTGDAVRAFLADTAADKRARMIDQLLNSDAYADRWTMWFGDLVQNVQASQFSREYPQGRNAFYVWIRDSFRSGKPYDQMVRQVLAGKGDNFIEGTSNYIVRQIQGNGPIQDTYDNLSAHSGERFLAMPMNCLSCHSGARHLEQVNIYLSTRTRMDFWKNAAFFARTSARVTPDPANPNIRKYMVTDLTEGSYRLNTVSGNKTPRQPEAGQPNFVDPAFFLSGEKPTPGEPYREAYGRFLTAHPQFARASVNYFWREMFGLALVEPAESMDLMRLDPATLPFGVTAQTLHHQLLERLTEWFRTNNYDVRGLLRLIANSSTYQLSMSYTPGPWNETWAPYFARHYARRLSSEATLDAIFVATGISAQLTISQMPTPVTRSMMLPDPLEPTNRGRVSQLLNAFGRGDRDENARTDESSIVQSLILLNDPEITTRVRQATANSTVQRTLTATREPAQIVETLYLATLSRRPTAEESTIAADYLRSGDLTRKTEDLQYVLINSLEFLFN